MKNCIRKRRMARLNIKGCIIRCNQVRSDRKKEIGRMENYLKNISTTVTLEQENIF